MDCSHNAIVEYRCYRACSQRVCTGHEIIVYSVNANKQRVRRTLWMTNEVPLPEGLSQHEPLRTSRMQCTIRLANEIGRSRETGTDGTDATLHSARSMRAPI